MTKLNRCLSPGYKLNHRHTRRARVFFWGRSTLNSYDEFNPTSLLGYHAQRKIVWICFTIGVVYKTFFNSFWAIVNNPGDDSSEKNCCRSMTLWQLEWKSSSESRKKCSSVDGVVSVVCCKWFSLRAGSPWGRKKSSLLESAKKKKELGEQSDQGRTWKTVDFVFDVNMCPWWEVCNKSVSKVIRSVKKLHFLNWQTVLIELIKQPGSSVII